LGHNFNLFLSKPPGRYDLALHSVRILGIGSYTRGNNHLMWVVCGAKEETITKEDAVGSVKKGV